MAEQVNSQPAANIVAQVRDILRKFAPERDKEIQMQIEAERKALIKDHARLAKSQIEEWIANSKAFNKANDTWQALVTKLADAEAERLRQHQHRQMIDSSFQGQMRQLDRQLRQSAPECLKVFVDDINAELEEIRQKQLWYSQPTGHVFRISQQPEYKRFSCQESRDARVTLMREDRAWAQEQAHLECASEEDAAAAIAERRAKWPEIRYTEVAA